MRGWKSGWLDSGGPGCRGRGGGSAPETDVAVGRNREHVCVAIVRKATVPVLVWRPIRQEKDKTILAALNQAQCPDRGCRDRYASYFDTRLVPNARHACPAAGVRASGQFTDQGRRDHPAPGATRAGRGPRAGPRRVQRRDRDPDSDRARPDPSCTTSSPWPRPRQRLMASASTTHRGSRAESCSAVSRGSIQERTAPVLTVPV